MWASSPTHRLSKSHASHSGGADPSAPTSVYRASALFFLCHSEGAKRPWESVPVSCQQRPKAATYLCRSAAKARFDNRQPPEGVSKEGGPQPSLFGRFKGKRFLRKGGNRNPPFLKPFFGYFLSGKKVTRRRQRKGKGTKSPRAGQSPAPTLRLPKALHHKEAARCSHRAAQRVDKPILSFRGREAPVGIRSPRPQARPPQKTHQDLRPRRRSCPQFSYNISRATGR